jgi:FAD:protein FMN transferase
MQVNGEKGEDSDNSTLAFSHHGMNTWWQVRLPSGDETYAAQAAQAAFGVIDRMERLMSRFRDDSEINAIACLPSGGRRRLPGEVFECLQLAEDIRELTGGSFDVRALAGLNPDELPRWRLDRETLEIIADAGSCRLDLGAIAKGFTLDRMAAELSDWGVDAFLLMSSGSSILAGEPPRGQIGWRVRIGEGNGAMKVALARRAIGTSGESMRGNHILDPATGMPATRHERSWAVAANAAEADALSTAWMNMSMDQIKACCLARADIGAVILGREGSVHRSGCLPEPV